MRSNTARVIDFRPKHQRFTAEELHLPKLPKTLDEVIRQVKPLFTEWMLAEATFEHNTLEVAKAVSRAWEIYKGAEPAGTKIGFARLLDTTIPEDAKTRDLGDNPTYNRIQYLLNKVGTTGERPEAPDREERLKKRQRALRGEWRRWVKSARLGAAELNSVRGLVVSLLGQFMPAENVKRAIA